jgi:ELWxxDGT repeat protein
MKTSLWRRWCRSLLSAKPTRPISRARPRRKPIGLEALEDRITPTLTPQMVLDINPGIWSSSPGGMVAIGSTVYFTADDGLHAYELWKSDGTAAGTTLVKDIFPGGGYWGYWGWYAASSYPSNLTNVNGTLFFTANDGTNGRELWKSDGTEAGTVLVKHINTSWASSYPSNLTNVNGTLFFTAYSATTGSELWRSDGTEAGTVLIKDIRPAEASSYPSTLTSVNGTLFFTADDGTNGRELWRSDGTEAGTVLVKDIFPGSTGSNPDNLTNVNGTLFFRATDGTSGGELWRSDGTATGTALVKDIFPGSASSYPISLTNVNGTLFFTAYSATTGSELWRSDGTAAGTALVKDINPGSDGSYPPNLTNVNGTLFFTAYSATTGRELWKSDGTEAGTVLVKDIRLGSDTSLDTSNMTNVNGTLVFAAYDGTGRNLWQSDGTEAGTVLVANLDPGLLTNINGTLFFAADDGVHGTELWKLVEDGQTQEMSLEVGGFPATVTAGVAGTFTVTVRNADGTINTGYRGTVHFTSSDPQAALPASYTFTAADQGVHTFSATLKTAGSQSITVSDTVVPGGAGTQTGITVNPAGVSRITVAGFPSPATAGVAGSFTVTARDAYGNRATGYTGTVRFTSGDPRAVLPGNYTFTAADAGTRTFGATLKTAGTQSLTATDTANGALVGTQRSILVNAAAASRLILSAPASVKAGTKFSLAVTVVDAYGNVVTGYRGTLSFSSSDRTAGLPKKYTFTAADQGTHTFTGLVLKKKGKQTITVTDTLDGSLTAGVTIAVL